MYKHGMCNTKLYYCWGAMLQRCYNINNKNHKYYYDKGIKVCDDWLFFSNFYNWALNNGYSEGLSLERKDNSKGYCPENCIWIPFKDQAKNKTNTLHTKIGGIDKCCAEWAHIFRISATTLYSRVKKLKDNEIIKPLRKNRFDVFIDLFNHRFYHKDLIKCLPDNMLILQWLSCYVVSFNINEEIDRYCFLKPILDYSLDHYYSYSILVYNEILNRNITIEFDAFLKLKENLLVLKKDNLLEIDQNELFKGWHSTRYLLQCLLEIEELYDCGGIEFEDWYKILNKTRNMHAYCEETYQSLFV